MTTRKTTGRFSAGTNGILGLTVRLVAGAALVAFLVQVAATVTRMGA